MAYIAITEPDIYFNQGEITQMEKVISDIEKKNEGYAAYVMGKWKKREKQRIQFLGSGKAEEHSTSFEVFLRVLEEGFEIISEEEAVELGLG